MSFSLLYALHQLFYRLWMFFYDWYVGAFYHIGAGTITVLETLDRRWAFAVTLKNIFKPLYGDNSLIGGVLGFFFRALRLIIAGSLYGVIIIIALAVYGGWALVPVYIIKKGFFN